MIGIKTNKLYFLFLLPIVIMIASAAFFGKLNQAMENNLISENFSEKKLAVSLMANHTDQFIALDNDWETEYQYYKQSLVFDMEALDSSYMTYAVVFDENLNPLSDQLNYFGGFDPLIYASFMKAIGENNMGDMVFNFTPELGQARDVYLHYRWIPTGNYKDKFLVVVAISKYTVMTKTDGWFKSGSVALISITAILNIAMVAVITWLVQGKKRRDKEKRMINLALT